MDIVCADIEASGLNPNEIFVLGVLDYRTDQFTGYTGDDIPDGLIRLASADYIIGHHFKGYDAKVIQRLTEGIVTIPHSRIIDTLDFSRNLFPKMPSHKLKDWGVIFDYPKLPFSDFSKFSQEMVPYCEQDCRITKKMIEFFRTVDEDVERMMASFE